MSWRSSTPLARAAFCVASTLIACIRQSLTLAVHTAQVSNTLRVVLARRSSQFDRSRILSGLRHHYLLKYRATAIGEVALSLTMGDQQPMPKEEIGAQQHRLLSGQV